MVILQFNKLIRNKWVWGAFAIAISAFFCLDDVILRGGGEEGALAGGAGTLAGEEVDAKLFSAIAEELRGLGNERDWKTDQSEINRRAWENYAALQVADKNGIEATDSEVRAMIRRDPSFQANGAFSFALYERLLREHSLTPERFEASLKRRVTLMRIGRSLLGAAAWASPMELDQSIADMTDTFTVKVATFTQTKAEANAVKLDDKGLKAWYEKNAKSLELPDRLRVRLVRFDATDAKLLAKMKVSEDEMRDRYDVTVDRYTTKGTNGVETVKKFEEVKGEIEKELRRIAAVNCLETNLNARVYGQAPVKKGASRLDEIAAESKAKVVTSDWFSLEGGYHPGFTKAASEICLGATGFAEAVAELDPASEDLRYAVVSSDKSVWLVEKADTSPRHVPTFEESKLAIRERALREAKADAFKASVEAIVKKGTKAVLATKSVSTNLTFTVSDIRSNEFENEMAVARAAMGLKKGDLSEVVPVDADKAIVVVCEERKAGDAAKAMILRSQVQADLTMLASRQLPEAWLKWNLERLGFVTGEISSVEKAEAAE